MKYDIRTEDWVAEADKHWFRKHPGRSTRVRRAFPKEFLSGGDSRVLVFQVFPGARLRIGINRDKYRLMKEAEKIGRAAHVAEALVGARPIMRSDGTEGRMSEFIAAVRSARPTH
jgi:hypothetical protein